MMRLKHTTKAKSRTRKIGVVVAAVASLPGMVFAATSGAATTAQAAPVYYQVINANGTNSCLQVNISGGKGNLVLGNCDRSAKQVWTISGGIFRNPVSGHCLDGNGADVYTFPCNGGAYQKWTTISSTPKKSIRHDWSGKFLDGNGAVGANVVFQPTIGTASRWVLDQV